MRVVCGWIVAMVLVGVAGAQGYGGQGMQVSQRQRANELVDINTATLEQMAALPGMGMAYARRVAAGRPYASKDQIYKRGILSENQYERMKPLIIARRPK